MTARLLGVVGWGWVWLDGSEGGLAAGGCWLPVFLYTSIATCHEMHDAVMLMCKKTAAGAELVLVSWCWCCLVTGVGRLVLVLAGCWCWQQAGAGAGWLLVLVGYWCWQVGWLAACAAAVACLDNRIKQYARVFIKSPKWCLQVRLSILIMKGQSFQGSFRQPLSMIPF